MASEKVDSFSARPIYMYKMFLFVVDYDGKSKPLTCTQMMSPLELYI